MAQFCVNIADQHIPLLISSMCGIYDYQETVPNPDPTDHPNPSFNPYIPEGPDNLKSIPPLILNPDYVEGLPETVPNPETIWNSQYNHNLPDSVVNTVTIPNPAWVPATIPNPAWVPATIPNPDFDLGSPESESNPSSISNPDYNPDTPETIPNPDYSPETPETIPNPNYDPDKPDPWPNLMYIPNPNYIPGKPDPWSNIQNIPNPEYNPPSIVTNPENPYQFVNRIVREWLNNNVKAYQSRLAAEAARVSTINSVNVDITDSN